MPLPPRKRSIPYIATQWVALVLMVYGWVKLPKAGRSTFENISEHGRLLLHNLAILPKSRVVDYGKVEPITVRPSNGTIAEVTTGFPSREEFQAKWLWKEPVVFRGAATKESGWDLSCFDGVDKDPVEALQKELSDKKFRIFRDEYDDGSADFMTFADYRRLVAESEADKTKNMPYARSFPIANLETCHKAVPTEKLSKYHSDYAITYKDMFANRVLFVSLNNETTTKMHIDIGDSFFTQVVGRKRWLFVDNKYATKMQIYGDTMNLVYIAGYDVHREQVPFDIPIKEVILNPGDVLYFPGMTFHAVYNLDPVTVGIDDTAMDLVGAFKRHWFLTMTTALNPWMIKNVVKQFWNTGTFDGYEMYFDGFSKNHHKPAGEEEEEEFKKEL